MPNELPLHTAVLKARDDVAAVVHAHPPRIVAADLAGIAVRPIVGAFDIPGTRLAAGGVPVYPRGVLVRDHSLAAEMVALMGERPVVVLRAHGHQRGAHRRAGLLQAISVDTIAGLSLDILSAGGTLNDLADEDMAELPDLGTGFNTGTAATPPERTSHYRPPSPRSGHHVAAHVARMPTKIEARRLTWKSVAAAVSRAASRKMAEGNASMRPHRWRRACRWSWPAAATGRLGGGPLGRQVFGHHGSSPSDVAASRGPNPRLRNKDNGITFISE